jgi:HlyD family secretion protein
VKKHALRYVLITIGILAVAAVLINVSFIGKRNDTAVPVKTYRVATGSLEDVVSGNGSLNPRSTINVAAQVSGEVGAVLVQEGDEVRKGAALFTIRADDYLLARDKASSALEVTRRSISQGLVTLRAQYRGASTTLADAKRTYEKNKDLFASKAVSQEAFQRSEDAYRTAQTSEQSAREQLNLRCGLDLAADPILTGDRDAAIIEGSPEVAQAALNLRSAEDTVRKCTVTAPDAGTVTMVKPGVGDWVQAGMVAVQVESLHDIVAEIQIDEVDIGQVAVGQRAEVTSDSIIGQTLAGTVTSVAPTVTTLGNTRVSLVRVQVDPVSFALKAGASCKARIKTQTKQGVLVLPLTAFIAEDNTSYVYRLKPIAKKTSKGEAVYQLEKVTIKIGVSDVSSVEVTSGLAEGDEIAVGALKLLREGIRVTVKEAQAP